MESLRVFNVSDILPFSRPEHGLLLPGVTNHITLVSDRGRNLYVRRTVKDNIAPLLESINREYQATGFFDKGGFYTIRSMPEQTEFMDRCKEPGAEVIRRYLRSITDAHNQGIIYGDRWGPNTIVNREGQLWHIDFDIQLAGSPAREFEITQAIYYSLYFAKDKESALLECTNFIDSPYFAIYDPSLVLDFLKGHVRYFRDGRYGGIQTEISRVTHAA